MENWEKGPKQSSKTVGCEIYTRAPWQMNNPNLNPEWKSIAENTMKKGQNGHEYANFSTIRENLRPTVKMFKTSACKKKHITACKEKLGEEFSTQ